jgi:hypothetical protein
VFDALLCRNWLFSPPNCLSLRISLLCTRPWINGPSSIYALPGWKYDLTLSLGLHQKVLTLFFVQTLLQVTARKTCDENHMMFASSKLITSSNNLILLSLPRVKSIATRVQWVHIQIAFWNSLISRIRTILTIQSVGWFTCLLCIVRIIGIFFSILVLTCRNWGDSISYHLCMKCVERIGWGRVWVLGFRVWGLRRRVGTLREVGKRHRTPFLQNEKKRPNSITYLFIYCMSI